LMKCINSLCAFREGGRHIFTEAEKRPPRESRKGGFDDFTWNAGPTANLILPDPEISVAAPEAAPFPER